MNTATMTLTAAQSEQERAAQLYGTPMFFYSLPTLRGQITRLRRVMSGYPVQLLFATMANDRAEILRTISREGVGACVNSIPHLQRAISHGFVPGKIQFTSCGLPAEDMVYLQSLGIAANLDSPSQIEAWCRLKPGMLVGARINAASLAGSLTAPDRIGMDIPSFERSREIARSLGGRVNGVHVYAGTNFQTARDILPTLRGLFDLARRFEDLDYVNIGGGIGVDYSHTAEPFDYEGFGAEVCAFAKEASIERDRPLNIFFEPGRSLVASSGLFITRVTDVKTLHGMRFVVVDASVSVFPRPFHHPGSYHRAYVIDMAEEEPTTSSVVVGRTTFSRDILGDYALPTSLEVGMLLAFEDAGAYCESMISRFLGQREPVCYISEN
jgi:diaminopimelate decarboxylase